MNPADGLLAGVLDNPDDPAPWLMLSDWLEEQGDPANLARAELLRLQTESAARKHRARRPKYLLKARSILEQHPGLLGAMQPLLDQGFAVLSAPTALALFLVASQTSVVDGPLTAGSSWKGELLQTPYSFATRLWIRHRDGNEIEGDMKEDFSAMYGSRVHGHFFFRGVVAGRAHLAFVTYQTKRAGIYPGLYQFRLDEQRCLRGTWSVPHWDMEGEMWLKQRRSRE